MYREMDMLFRLRREGVEGSWLIGEHQQGGEG
jgi:hypothetical protein